MVPFSTQDPLPAGDKEAVSLPESPPRSPWRHRLEMLTAFLQRNERLLWWCHSAYALLLGIFVMWLGSRNFGFLRVVIFHIAFIWLSSLFLPALAGSSWISTRWQARARLVINYFNKNFYQQLLFFVLPLYYSSTTLGSRNMLFVVLLAVSAVLSTMDVVYDRYLSARRPLTAVFFAFNLFACINVMLPVLWRISNHRALWISGALALAGFVTILYVRRGLPRASTLWVILLVTLTLSGMIFFLRGFIPPAPLGLAGVQFGETIRGLTIPTPLEALPSNPGRIIALTAVKAPLGLHEQVRHVWFSNGKLLYASPFYTVTGGREGGYRIWSQITWNDNGSSLVLDVETRGEQLIGRARLSR